ncbi:beta-2 adrenergic receptor [Biomphalaria glabrata]|nr:beta-2 adrenergic receptor [Biomphalaria glabrata]
MNNSSYCPVGATHVNIANSQKVTIALTVMCSVLAAYVCVTNVAVILALCRRSAQSLRDGHRTSGGSNSLPCHVLIVSLSVADAITGFTNMPLGTYVIGNSGRCALGKELCFFWIWLDKVLCTVCIYHVALMALDRYIAICRPLVYRLMSKKTTLTLIALSWLFPTIISTILISGAWHHSDIDWLLNCAELAGICTPIYNRTDLIAMSILEFFLPFLVILVLYFLVIFKIYRLDKNPMLQGRPKRTKKEEVNPKSHSVSDLVLRKWSPREENTDEGFDAKVSTSERILQPACVVNTKESLNVIEGTLKCLHSDSRSNTALFNHSKQRLVLAGEDHGPGVNDTHTIICDFKDLKCERDKAFGTGDSKSVCTNSVRKMRKCFKNTKYATHFSDASDVTALSVTNSDQSIFKLSSSHFISNLNSGAVNDRSALKVFQARHKYVIPAKNAKRKSRDKPEASPTRMRSNQQNKTSKAFTTIGCVVVCFTICWLPFSVYNFALVYSDYKMASWPFLLFWWMGYLNSAINPILYCFTRSVRQAIFALLIPSKQRKF